MASGEQTSKAADSTLAIETIRLCLMRKVEPKMFLIVPSKSSYILTEPGKLTAKSNEQYFMS